MEGSRPPYISGLWRTSLRPSGVSWLGERRVWIRHFAYWVIALGLISATALDGTAHPVAGESPDVVPFAIFVAFLIGLPIVGLMLTLREWDQVGVARTLSRSLVVFTFLLGIVTAVLVFARRWGVHIEACRTVGELETCQGQASPRQALGMFAWHAANAVPVLDITHSLEWQRPARSTNAFVGTSILVLRLWVAIGILAVLKRVWDKWGPGGSSPTVSR